MRLIILLILLAIPSTSASQQGTYHNKFGEYSGGWEGNSQHLEFHDGNGSYAGNADRDNDGWTFQDRNGDYSGGSDGSAGISQFPHNNKNN